MYSTQVNGEVLRFGTSGLLYRSNKLMYDRNTNTLWTQFLGEPVVGPLADSGIVLERLPVVLTTWGEWRTAHPDTTVPIVDPGFYCMESYLREEDSCSAYADYRASPNTMAQNGAIFGPQGKAINDHASRDVKVLIVGNPANTNCLIAQSAAPDLDPKQFAAMTRLDHNRAISQLAEKTGAHVNDIKKMVIWGNHSATQYPDISKCAIEGQPASSKVEQDWYREVFIPKVQKRGAEIIQARGASSAASAASAAIDHVRDWTMGTPADDWVSMAIPSDGSYGVKPGIIYSYPCTCKNGQYHIVQGLTTDNFSSQKMKATEIELREERASVESLL